MGINRNKPLPLIIQGGMGVGVSLGNLAGNVAKCGGMGVISSVNAGFRETDFNVNAKEANARAFREEIKKAKKIADGQGLIAVNIMVATNFYEEMVQIAVEEKVDAIISGAGLPLDLPIYTKGTNTLAAPIISSGKAAALMCKAWEKRYGIVPDFLVLEGALAGGHLGFKMEDLEENKVESLDEILPQVLEAIAPYEELKGRKIPVFVAGGIFTGKEIAHFVEMGASGVQIATRFIATIECDASIGYKEAMLVAKEEDIVLVKSPVGMPGRAINSPLVKNLFRGETFPPKTCNICLKVCPKKNQTIYCISQALIDAVNGNWETGLFFCGANVGKVKTIVSVKELMDELLEEYNKFHVVGGLT